MRMKESKSINKNKAHNFNCEFCFSTSSLIAVVYINRDYISLYFEDINLTLKADKVEIGMSKSFNPSDT